MCINMNGMILAEMPWRIVASMGFNLLVCEITVVISSISVDGILFGEAEADGAYRVGLVALIYSPVTFYPSNSQQSLKAKRRIVSRECSGCVVLTELELLQPYRVLDVSK